MGCTIAEFYENENIFFTGATGFVGKVIVEKLLYSCPNIGSIYILIREKKGKSTKERFQELLKSKAFSRLNEDQLKKIIPVEGDLTKEDFNLSEHDKAELKKNVSIIIHSAATVKFNEPLKTAVELNVLPIRWVINLGKSLDNLICICYVSTAYTQCYKSKFSLIQERVQEPPLDYEEIISHVYKYAEEDIYKYSKDEPGKYPNSYTLTKAIGEYMFQQEGKGLPLVVLRPSIVSCSLREPLPGWVDTFHGMTGTMAGIITGVIRTWLLKDCINDIVPVDLVSNCVIASIWYAITQKSVEYPFVCNCISGSENPTSMVQLINWMKEILAEKPIDAMVRQPDFEGTSSPTMYAYRRFTRHLIPAAVVDSISPLSGRKTKMLEHYDRIHEGVKAIKFFAVNEWVWQTTNQKKVLKAMSDSDSKVFNFDMSSFSWKKFSGIMVKGIDQFLLKKREGTASPSSRGTSPVPSPNISREPSPTISREQSPVPNENGKKETEQQQNGNIQNGVTKCIVGKTTSNGFFNISIED